MLPGVQQDLASVEFDRREDVTIAEITGEIDLSNATSIGESLAGASQGKSLVIDVSPLEYLDSAGIAMLHDLAKRLGDDRIRLVVSDGAIVARALDVAGVHAIIRVEPSVDAALGTLV